MTSCGLFILCFTVVSSSFIVAAGWAASSDAMYSTGASWEYASRTCDTGNSGNKDKHLNLCLLSWYIRLPMLWASVAFLIALGILVYFIPPRLREAVAVAAAKRTNDMWLLRTGKLHWYLFPAIVLQAFNLYAFMAMEYHVAPAAVVEASGAIGILLLLHTSGLALWILPKQQLWLSLKRKKITPCSSLGVIQSPGRASFWTSIGRALRSLIYIRLEGVYQRKHYLMILIGVAFSGVVVGSGPGYFAAMMGVRATLLGLFLFSRDETDDFASLSRDQYGPGYGLVVDACLLEEALRRHLEGRKPSMERLPTYKATLYRMDNTLAGEEPSTFFHLSVLATATSWRPSQGALRPDWILA